MPYTAIGNSRFAGNAAMNCAIGCTIWAARGRIPTQMPMGTQTRLARAIRTNTRTMVMNARPHTCNASLSGVLVDQHGDDVPEARRDRHHDKRHP